MQVALFARAASCKLCCSLPVHAWQQPCIQHHPDFSASPLSTGPALVTRRQPHSTVAHAFSLSAPGMCFDAACQAAADNAFVVAISVPLGLALAALVFILKPPPKELVDEGKVFEDPSTGAVFETNKEAVQPERDSKGELVFRPISYTPWPVEEGYEGERVRIPVGPIRDRQPRTFVFKRLLPAPSDIVVATLRRPLGVVFEYDPRKQHAVVVDLVEGSAADQKRRVAGLNQQLANAAVLPGDVLRAVTATNFVYPTNALFGAQPPQRHVVVYGADRQSWNSISGALRKGDVKDGEVTLVLERRKTLEQQQQQTQQQ